MIFYFTIIAPFSFFLFRIFNFTLYQSLFLLFILYFIIYLLRKLDRTDFFKEYTCSLLELKFTQEILYRTLLLEDYLLAHPFSGWLVSLLLSYVWVNFLIINQDPSSLFYWFFLFMYWYALSYCRFRFAFLNDFNLNLYAGRSSFDWQDVIREIGNSLQFSLNNRVQKSKHSFGNIIPKRNMHKAAGKVWENPEVQKAAVTAASGGAVAIGVALVPVFQVAGEAIQYNVSTPEKRNVLDAEKELSSATKTLENCVSKMNLLPQKPLDETALQTRKYCEANTAKAILAQDKALETLETNKTILAESSTAVLKANTAIDPLDFFG
jgi:hypothetical protein